MMSSDSEPHRRVSDRAGTRPRRCAGHDWKHALASSRTRQPAPRGVAEGTAAVPPVVRTRTLRFVHTRETFHKHGSWFAVEVVAVVAAVVEDVVGIAGTSTQSRQLVNNQHWE